MTMTPERFRAIHGIFKGQWNASGSPGTGSRLFCKLCQADVDSKHHKDCMVGAIHELLAHIDTLTAELADARRREEGTITICGSSRFIQIMAAVGWWIERDEGLRVFNLHYLPEWACNVADHAAEHENVADHFDRLHLSKIDLSGSIFVVDWGGYIGESTRREIEYAVGNGTTVRYLSKEPRYLMMLDQPAPETAVCVWEQIHEGGPFFLGCDGSEIWIKPDHVVPDFCQNCGKPIKIDAEDE